MNYAILIITLIPLIAYVNFMTHTKHLLMSLLCLELMTLSMVLLIVASLMTNSMSIPMISIVILTLGACEASLGLTIMVKMSRSYGNDLLKSNSNQLC
uniref:NADH-ubiquinone oxidoreductase chain 4L n=1 Tax=Ozobranchus jantseanus TaxID=1955321 RepID=A0A343D0L8_9ANNE|nr:NADH dehydrogenase subunit 4L [Ozobranchus jantseanus]ARR75357.1 NADH dehydrogenase subunit 4L [Ozobranchus jantseanus]WOA02257.1 NADH dehydrogenase subunit 4L [Ozobranchus jantseanus]